MSYTDDFTLNFGSAHTGKAASVRLRWVNGAGQQVGSTIMPFAEVGAGTGNYIKQSVTVPNSCAVGFYGATTSSAGAAVTSVATLNNYVTDLTTGRIDNLDYLDVLLSSRASTAELDSALAATTVVANVRKIKGTTANADNVVTRIDATVSSRASTAEVDSAIAAGITSLPTTAQMDTLLAPLATTANIDTALAASTITADVVKVKGSTLNTDNIVARIDATISSRASTAEVDTAIANLPTTGQLDAALAPLPTTSQMDTYMNPLATTSNVDTALTAYNAATTANVDSALADLNAHIRGKWTVNSTALKVWDAGGATIRWRQDLSDDGVTLTKTSAITT